MRLTTNLIEICYDCSSGTRSTPADEKLDINGITDQLVGLRNALEELFRAANTVQTARLDSLDMTTPESSEHVICALLVKCRNEINEIRVVLNQESERKGVKEPQPSNQSSLRVALGNLVMSTTSLRAVIDGGRRYVVDLLKPGA